MTDEYVTNRYGYPSKVTEVTDCGVRPPASLSADAERAAWWSGWYAARNRNVGASNAELHRLGQVIDELERTVERERRVCARLVERLESRDRRSMQWWHWLVPPVLVLSAVVLSWLIARETL